MHFHLRPWFMYPHAVWMLLHISILESVSCKNLWVSHIVCVCDTCNWTRVPVAEVVYLHVCIKCVCECGVWAGDCDGLTPCHSISSSSSSLPLTPAARRLYPHLPVYTLPATNYQALTPTLSTGGRRGIHTLGHTVTALPGNRYTEREGSEQENTITLHENKCW